MVSSSQTGHAGIVRVRVATANTAPMVTIAARGRTRSATDSNVAAATTCANDAPNIDRADSRAEPVRAYTRVLNASPLIVAAAVRTDVATKSGVNSATLNTCR